MKSGVVLWDICDLLLSGTRESWLSLVIGQCSVPTAKFLFLEDMIMRIAGLQKASVIDYPGEIACTIFLYGCNFRCGFCYNPSLVLGEGLRDGFGEKGILEFLRKRVGKLDAVCITGGEPLMSLDFDFVRKIKALGYKVKVDTNGSFPDRLNEMIDLGLVDYVAMDIKGCRDRYNLISNVDVDIEKIEESIKLVHDFGEYEFRMTVVERFHSKESVVEMAKWVSGVCGGKPKRFFLQGFKNKGSFVDVSFSEEKDVSEKFLEELKECVEDYFEFVGLRV